MKAEIHPKYQTTTFLCACGNKVEVRSTSKDLHLDICSACHPFFTGKQKLMDTAGRIEKFTKKYQKANAAKEAQKAAKEVKESPAQEPAPN